MNSKNPFSRRAFMARVTAAGSTLALLGADSVFAQTNTATRFKIGGFTKPFQDLNFENTADVVAEVGWDGVECPVRRGGQVLPEKVEDDLPRLVEALKKRNLEIFTIATDIHNASDPLTEKVLRTAARLGIKIYRLASLHYDLTRPIPPQLEKFKADLKELQALNQELGLCAAYENHSGSDYVGAPVWDVYGMIKDFDPKQYGFCFDIAHATIEGGSDWKIQLNLIESRLSAVYVKDFYWQKGSKAWTSHWCPLGEGMVDPAFFQRLAKTGFRGPIIQHHEYPLGAGKNMIALLKQDRETLRKLLPAV